MEKDLTSVFKLIKVMDINDEVKPTVGEFVKMMEANYNFDRIQEIFNSDPDEEATSDDESLVEEMERVGKFYIGKPADPKTLYDLPIGTIFKGITEKSIQYLYAIISEFTDDNGRRIPIWYPINGSEGDLVGCVSKFNFSTNSWDILTIDIIPSLPYAIYNNDDPCGFYRITDLNNEPIDVFDDEDEDSHGIYFCSLDPSSDEEGDADYIIKPVDTYLELLPLAVDFKNQYTRLVNTLQHGTAVTQPHECHCHDCDCDHGDEEYVKPSTNEFCM